MADLPMSHGDDASSNIYDKVSIAVDTVWQFLHVGVAFFLFYEDRILCVYSLTGFLGVMASVSALGSSGKYMPTFGDTLWRISIPSCAILSVVISMISRLMGWFSYSAMCGISAILLIMTIAITTLTVRSDKDARLKM
eukprot:TRINITY_DN21916_c0_g1_i1.p1 TRINITY_DN21916_c0_g1~~TRINITY_DN21916_c0_g1_i1.p1  ORF type:complete len:138 (+),score=1.47 TRINITY_DN21916_c0_g1_i1:89-502(+)